MRLSEYVAERDDELRVLLKACVTVCLRVGNDASGLA